MQHSPNEYIRTKGLEIKQLKVSLTEKEILHKVSLSVRGGELVSLLGPSGCGKSTMLKAIAGIIEAKSGEIYIDGESVVNMPTENRGTVIVFQDLRLFPNMTVEGNIEFALKLQKIEKSQRKQLIKHLLESVKLSGFEKRKISQMSGGQMQRVALARAVAAKPRVLLLDEPFSSLDEELREEMRSLVLELHREYNMTILLVTHDKNEALFMSDKIALMINGEIIQCDTPKEIYQAPINKKVSDYFGGCSYINGKVKEGKFISDVLVADARKYVDGDYCARILPSMIIFNKNNKKNIYWEIIGIKYKGNKSEITLRHEEHLLFIESTSSENFSVGQALELELEIGIEEGNLQLFSNF